MALKRTLYLAAALANCPAMTAHAATALSEVRYTPDVTITLAGTPVGPADVSSDNLAGTVALALPALPANLAAYHYTGSVHWLVFDATVLLPGGITATPRDIIAWNGSSYSPIFSGAAAGIPDGVAIDALASLTGTDYLLSFDTTAMVGAITAAPADVVHYNGSWSMHFAAAAAGVPAGANLDALDRLANGHLLVSFDVSGTVGGITFDDEDVLEFTPGGDLWELAYRPSTLHPTWAAADLQALWAQPAPLVPGVLQFSAPTYTVNENGMSVSIAVTRTGGASGAVTVNYSTANGSAAQPSDYAAASGTLNWADGDTAPKTFTVTIVNDAIVEGMESVLLALSNITGGASYGANATATLFITDDDLPSNTPFAALSTTNLNFGNQLMFTTSGMQGLTVTNTGTAPLIIATVSLGGGQPGDFALAVNACAGATLGPMASCALAANFTPSAVGARSATVSIATNAPGSPAVATLSGIGIAAAPGPGDAMPIPTLGGRALLLLNALLAATALRGWSRHKPAAPQKIRLLYP